MIGALVTSLAATTLAGQQPPPQVFRSGVDIVSLSVTVTDTQNHYLTDLEQTDFTVVEDGARQELLYFSKSNLPIALSLLIDTSASMEERLLVAQNAAVGFAQRIREQDLAQVIDFDSRVQIAQEFTSDKAALEAAIRGTSSGGSTSLYNAIYIALRELKKVRAKKQEDVRRDAIIVLSDGEDTTSLVSFEEVMELAKRSETSIYTIGLQPREPAYVKGFREAEFVLRQLAQETGGRAFFVQKAEELTGVYGQIADELSSQYSLGYTLQEPQARRRVAEGVGAGGAAERGDANAARLLRAVALESPRASNRLHHRRRSRGARPHQRARPARAPVGAGGHPRLARSIPRLLALAPATAERIDVGSAAPQAAEQDAINLLIAEKAREGQLVARLKWGDPFLFDRGGPEALFLHEQGVPFEVIPGVPALLAAPAFAGIPLSYPGAGDTITFVRGIEDEGRTPPSTDWGSLARLGGTLACFTGPRQMPAIVGSLLAHGRPATETAAFVQHGHVVVAADDHRAARRDLARVQEAEQRGPGRPRDRPGRRLPRAPPVVRQPPAVRPPRAGDAVAEPGTGPRGAPRAERRRGGGGAGVPDRPAGRSRTAGARGRGRPIVRLGRLHEHQRRRGAGRPGPHRRAGPARAGRTAHLRRRPGHGLAAASLRREPGPRTGRSPSARRDCRDGRRGGAEGRARAAAGLGSHRRHARRSAPRGRAPR